MSCDGDTVVQNALDVDYFPTTTGPIWVYDIHFTDRSDYSSREATGTLTLELINVDSDGKSYDFCSTYEGSWRVREWGWPGAYDTTYHRITSQIITIKSINGKLQAERAPQGIESTFTQMFNFITPQKFYRRNGEPVSLEYRPSERIGVEIELIPHVGLTNFWCDTGGSILAFKQYTTINMYIISYSSG